MKTIKSASRKTNNLRRNLAGPFLASSAIHLIIIVIFSGIAAGKLLEKKKVNTTFAVKLLHTISQKPTIISSKRPDILAVLNSENTPAAEPVAEHQDYNSQYPAAPVPAWQQMPEWISSPQKNVGNSGHYSNNEVQLPAIPVKSPEIAIDLSSVNENDILLTVDLYINDKGIVEKTVVISTIFDTNTANQMANKLGHTLFRPAIKDSRGVPYLMRIRVTPQGIDEIPSS